MKGEPLNESVAKAVNDVFITGAVHFTAGALTAHGLFPLAVALECTHFGWDMAGLADKNKIEEALAKSEAKAAEHIADNVKT